METYSLVSSGEGRPRGTESTCGQTRAKHMKASGIREGSMGTGSGPGLMGTRTLDSGRTALLMGLECRSRPTVTDMRVSGTTPRNMGRAQKCTRMEMSTLETTEKGFLTVLESTYGPTRVFSRVRLLTV